MSERTYEVTFRGTASPTLRAAFEGYELEAATGATVVHCRDDQLHSVLNRLQDLSLELIEVRSGMP